MGPIGLHGKSPIAGSESRKSHYRGTHRTLSPAQTKSRITPYGRAFGITRVANVTGLDYLGIPVFMAVRPNSRSLAVSQGKGLDEDSAWVSAFMEAAELEHAETMDAAWEVASYAKLRLGRHVVNPFRLPRTRGKPFDAGKPIPWTKARDLVSGNEVWVPSELVHMDYRYPAAPNSNALFHSSNGLASGNDLPEAICAGLCELIERDAVCLWRERSATSRARTRLILETVSDGDCRALLEHLARHEMTVAVWDTTSDVTVASFVCRIRETANNTRSAFGAFWGSGTHLSREVAFLRAVTEAVQTRLTYIAGSRDDLLRRHYTPRKVSPAERAVDLWEQANASRCFEGVPSRAAESLDADLAQILDRLRAVGLAQALLVDLSKPQVGISVARVIVPGLEAARDDGRHFRGARARAAARARPVQR